MHAVLPIDDVFFRRSLVLPNWLPNDFRKLLLHPPVTKLLRAHGELRVNKSLRYTGPHCGVRTDRQTDKRNLFGPLFTVFSSVLYCVRYTSSYGPAAYDSFRMAQWAFFVRPLVPSPVWACDVFSHVRMGFMGM